MIRKIAIAPETLVLLCKAPRGDGYLVRIVGNGLPEDARFVRCTMTPQSMGPQVVYLYVDSAAFNDATPEQLPPPIFESVIPWKIQTSGLGDYGRASSRDPGPPPKNDERHFSGKVAPDGDGRQPYSAPKLLRFPE